MAWTTPFTAVDGEALSAAQMASVMANMDQSLTGLADGAGKLFSVPANQSDIFPIAPQQIEYPGTHSTSGIAPMPGTDGETGITVSNVTHVRVWWGARITPSSSNCGEMMVSIRRPPLTGYDKNSTSISAFGVDTISGSHTFGELDIAETYLIEPRYSSSVNGESVSFSQRYLTVLAF